jgi:hypothetical protein
MCGAALGDGAWTGSAARMNFATLRRRLTVLVERFACGGGLFGHGGVLPGDLVEPGHSHVDLTEADRPFLSAGSGTRSHAGLAVSPAIARNLEA